MSGFIGLERAAQSAAQSGLSRNGLSFDDELDDFQVNVHYGGISDDSGDEASIPSRAVASSNASELTEMSSDFNTLTVADSVNGTGRTSSADGELASEDTESTLQPGPSDGTSEANNSTEVVTMAEPISPSFVPQQVTNFIGTLQEPKYTSPLSGEEIAGLFQAFYASSKTQLESPEPAEQPLLSKTEMAARRLAADARTAEIEQVLEDLEKQVTSRLYTKIFDSASDAGPAGRFEARLSALRSHPSLLEKLDLGLDQEKRFGLEPAIARIAKVGQAHTPSGKLEHIVDAHKAIVEALGNDSSSADLLLPSLIYVVLASNLTSVWRQIVFVRRFRYAEAIQGHEGYCLTNTEAAIRVLESIHFSRDVLPSDVDPALFAAPPATMLASSRHRSTSSASLSLSANRSRSASQSSRASSNISGSVQSRLGSFSTSMGNSYRYFMGRLNKEDSEFGGPPSPLANPPGASQTSIVSVPNVTIHDTNMGSFGPSPPLPHGHPAGVPGGIAPSMPHGYNYGPPPPFPSLTDTLPTLSMRFMTAEPDSLTLGETRALLDEYKRLAAFIQSLPRNGP